jgi:hypothetical protein
MEYLLLTRKVMEAGLLPIWIKGAGAIQPHIPAMAT